MLMHEEIKDYLKYEPATGVFTWIKSPSYRVKEGDLAGTDDGRGYLVITFQRKRHYCHRLAFKLMGVDLDKAEYIDHINSNKSDNRWENLRLASP